MSLPQNYSLIQITDSLSALFNAPFNPANLIFCKRPLTNDFNPLAGRMLALYPYDFRRYRTLGMGALERTRDDFMKNGEKGLADDADFILTDMKDVESLLKAAAQKRQMPLAYHLGLRVLGPEGYKGQEISVHRYHEDEVLGPLGYLMCSYNNRGTTWLRNDQAEHIQGSREYKEKEKAEPFDSEPGDFTRHAGFDGPRVPATIHKGYPGTRLLLVGGLSPYGSPTLSL